MPNCRPRVSRSEISVSGPCRVSIRSDKALLKAMAARSRSSGLTQRPISMLLKPKRRRTSAKVSVSATNITFVRYCI